MGVTAQDAVLIADDDPAIRLLCRVNLELDGYRVVEAANADDVDGALASGDVRAVLLDVHLGPDDGLAVARELRRTRPDVKVALLTGSAQRQADWDALADGFLAKPFRLEDLAETVRLLVRP